MNKDGAIDLAELYEYVKPNVQRVARKQYNNEQTPQLLASPELLRRGADGSLNHGSLEKWDSMHLASVLSPFKSESS